MSAAWVEIDSPGLLSTVQDLGRPGHAHEGVAASGAADPFSARAANRLVGNDDAAPLVEMTLVGGAFRFPEGGRVALTGAPCDGPLVPWRAVAIEPGGSIRLGPMREGARAYLAVRGGLAVPRFLGSASTHLLSGLGGLAGRALRRGDRLPIGPEPVAPAADRADARSIRSLVMRRLLRVTPGAQRDRFTPEAVRALLEEPFHVTGSSDRAGLRLDGPILPPRGGPPMPTEGVLPGAIQVSEGGRPIVLMVEHGTTGGYPKIADVIAADLPALGQLRPGDTVRFTEVGWDEARDALAEAVRVLDAAVAPAGGRGG